MFKNGMRRLQKAYEKGFTVYPRVSYDYIKQPLILFYPHPPLSKFDNYSKPLKEKKYKVKYQTLPLLLENLRISTPATILRNLNYIQRYYNQDLTIKKENKIVLGKKLERFDDFLNQSIKEKIIKNKESIDILFPDGIIAKQNMQISAFNIPPPIGYKGYRDIGKFKATSIKHNIKNFENLKISKKAFDIKKIQDDMEKKYKKMKLTDKLAHFDLELLDLDIVLNEFNNVTEELIDKDVDTIIYLGFEEDSFEEWKLKLKNRYNQKYNINDFFVKKDANRVILSGKGQYKGIKLIDKGKEIVGFGNDMKIKANAMIDVALAKGWNLDKLNVSGSKEFRKEVNLLILKQKTKVTNEPRPR